MRKTVLSGAIALAIISLNVNALSVGEMDVRSFLGEPLNVSIDLSSATKSELSTLEVTLAPRSSFAQAQITYPKNAENLLIEVDSSNKGSPKILVKSVNSISEPFVHLLLKISWAGGNMLREYTALIDPVEYKPQPMAKAAAADTKLSVAKPAAKADKSKINNGKAAKVHGLVKSGDSLSAIAALYRPADVSIHQAWVAFYNLNPEAFPDQNLNRIQKGSQILIPTRTQMMAISQSKAVQEVKKLTKPLSIGGSANAKPTTGKVTPKLVVGGGKDEEPAPAAKRSKKKSAESGDAVPAAGFDQLASIKAEFSAFKQDITRKLEESREQTTEAKEQLVAARGQNRVLNERIEELEKQIYNVNELLELQKNAVQALSEDSAQDEQVQQAVSANQTNDQTAESDEQKDAAMLQSSQTMPASDDANTDVPEADSTVASLSEQSARVDANNQAQAQISESEQRIVLLEKELQEKIEREAQSKAQAQAAMEQSDASQKVVSEPEQPQAVVGASTANNQTPTPRVQAEQGFADKATGVLGSIRSVLAGISSDIWKIIGVIAAALLGLFLYSSKRRSREEEFEDEDSFIFSQLEDIGDGATDEEVNHLAGEEDSLPNMQSAQTGDENDVSALFDLSDESFMASEAMENDSSLFAMDEEFGSFGKMASSGGVKGSALQSSIPQMGDVDPVTEAEVYLAYDRKEQALNVLEQALQENPNQGNVVSKLLTLYREADDVDAFTRLFESSVENVNDDEHWSDIKQIAQAYIPTHKFVDDFDSSIPVLHDEIAEENPQKEDLSDLHQEASNPVQNNSIELEATAKDDDDDILAAAIQELKGEDALDSDPSDVLILDDVEIDLDEASMMFVEDDPEITADKDEFVLDITPENEQEQSAVHEETLDIADDISEQESDVDMQEINEHDPETALALAKAYIELGENDIAKDFLIDVIDAGSEKVKGEAEVLLATMS